MVMTVGKKNKELSIIDLQKIRFLTLREVRDGRGLLDLEYENKPSYCIWFKDYDSASECYNKIKNYMESGGRYLEVSWFFNYQDGDMEVFL